VGTGPSYGEFKTDYESIFERMGRSTRHGGTGSIRSAIVDHGNPAVMHGSKATTTVPCKTDDEVLQGLQQAVPTHQFTFGRFLALADSLGCESFLTHELRIDTI
jgi:RNA exonuclease 1